MKIFFPGFSVAKNHIKKPSKVISALGYGLIGSAVAFVSTSKIVQRSNIIYGQEAKISDESSEVRLERCKKEQKERLEKLIGYAEKNDLDSLVSGLSDLNKFYSENYGDYQSNLDKTKEERVELTTLGKAQYEKIYLELFKILEAANTKAEYEKLEKAFWELTYTIPLRWHDVESVPELIKVEDHLSKYFDEQSAKAKDDTEAAIKLANEGRIILKFLKEKSADLVFSENYCRFIEEQASYVVKNYESNDPNIKRLSSALFDNVHQILKSSYHYMPMQIYKDFDLKVKLFMPLIKAYSNLYTVEEKTPQNITNALERAVRIKGEFKDSEARKHPELLSTVDEAIQPLIGLSIKAIFEMPESSEDRNKLVGVVFDLPCNSYFNQSPQHSNEKLFVKPITKYYFLKEENAGNLEDFKLFLSKIFAKGGQMENGVTDFDRYTLLALIDRNHNYFKKAVEALIEDHLKRNGTTDEELIYAFSVFSRLHRMSGSDYSSTLVLQNKVRDYAIPNLAAPIFQVFLDRLKDQPVKVTFNERRQERYINANDWRNLNDQFREMLGYCYLFEDELLDAVYKGLEKETDPFKRQIYYETLGLILPNEFQYTKGIGLLDRLKMANTSETSCHAVREMGKLIAGAIQYEDEHVVYDYTRENISASDEDAIDGPPVKVTKIPKFQEYSTFVEKLKKFNDREITLLEFGVEGKLKTTRTQKLLEDLMRLSYGDMQLMKELMPDRRFPGPTCTVKYKIDGEIETVTFTYGIQDENYERYKYLRSNAIRLSEELTYSEENKRDREVYIRTMHNAYMVLAYTSAYVPDSAFKDEMIRLLEDHYGWMYTDPYKWGERYGALNEAYLNRYETLGEQRKYVAKKMEELKKKLFEGKVGVLNPEHGRTQRLFGSIFAKNMMDSAPSGQRRTYMESLNHLGFSDHDLSNIDFLIKLYTEKD